jgi:hypothetical protein
MLMPRLGENQAPSLGKENRAQSQRQANPRPQLDRGCSGWAEFEDQGLGMRCAEPVLGNSEAKKAY